MAPESHFKTINPANGELIKSFPSANDEEVHAALDKAHEVYTKDWRHRSVEDRCKIMGKAAELMRQRKQELVELAVLEMGKTIAGMQWEVDLSADILAYYADHGSEFLAPKPLPDAPGAVVVSDPIGVVLAIEPWNFPYYQIARVAGPQLVVGNTVLLKHAASVPQCALAVEKLFVDAGAPPGVYTNLFCSISQVNDLIVDSRVRGITLTGSERAGASVAELAGRNLKKVVLELGGSDPLIVLEDAPLQDAIETGVNMRLFSMGQACTATKRFIVVGKERGQIFAEGVVKKFAELNAGDPMDPKTTLGPLYAEAGLKGLLEQVEEARAAGATVVCGGGKIDRPGFYMEPALITNIDRKNPLFMKETFGPIASLYVVDNEEEAIELANATPYGLASIVYSSNHERAQKVARQIEAGMVFINQMFTTQPNLPFGGVKNSGFGRELSELGINEFINKKLIKA
ncbi:aldehyde dehydrogenase [Microthyrium microscopicum]|uniref:Aldehyde dehydrogenase n=1 Tax=Microthyrium microscopicum TaxID=703497 RepID=A0A6A6UCB7_9PEZI|nr:aldehyde dehydrogenase [Microthyrium microscopicum]